MAAQVPCQFLSVHLPQFFLDADLENSLYIERKDIAFHQDQLPTFYLHRNRRNLFGVLTYTRQSHLKTACNNIYQIAHYQGYNLQGLEAVLRIFHHPLLSKHFQTRHLLQLQSRRVSTNQ